MDNHKGGNKMNKEEIEKYDPNLLKVIESMIMSSIRSDIDEMVEQGLVYMTADSDGNIIYELTAEGQYYLDEN